MVGRALNPVCRKGGSETKSIGLNRSVANAKCGGKEPLIASRITISGSSCATADKPIPELRRISASRVE
jgi:hypothetical protein